uniref:hypothetical protein n=1 Tax=Roseivirga sp. TaxID=1964215 RepID=UPI0040482B98
MKKILPLAFLLFSSACSFTQRYHKLTVSTDTYALDEATKIKIDSIFIDNSPAESDLSLLVLSQSIKSQLGEFGYKVSSTEKSPYKLIYEFSLSAPISRISSSTSESISSTTILKENKDGNEEEHIVESKVSYPTYSQYYVYKHKLKVKLFRTIDQKLVWQSESELNSVKHNSATYSKLLVKTTLQNFLQNSTEHPQSKTYNKRHQKNISESF